MLLKLNLGCGSNKIDGYVNIDVEESCKPDKIVDFTKEKLPYKDNSVSEILLFHCIEHITKHRHKPMLLEMWRVLKPAGRVVISYPEFLRCVENWKKNYRGKRDFWEATLYGRQLYPSDYHVAIMHTPFFSDLLIECGFVDIVSRPEPVELYNTVISGLKGKKPTNYESLIKDHVESTKFKKV